MRTAGTNSDAQVTSIGQHLDHLSAQLLVDNQEAARLTATGDAANAHARLLDVNATLAACYRDSMAMIPLENEARTAYHKGLRSATLVLQRAQDAERAHHPLTLYGVTESTAMITEVTALIAATDSELAPGLSSPGHSCPGAPLCQRGAHSCSRFQAIP